MSHDINIHHITRVEGHGNIVLNIKEGRIEELRLEIVESPRFFEVMLLGRNILEAPPITSRICGICAISHTEASIKACEDALGFTPSENVVLLRKVLLHAELLQSHILHLYLLVAPDLFGAGSVIPLASSNPDLIKLGLRLKKAANDICKVLVGRHIHPIGMVVGGFTKPPAVKDLDEVRRILEGMIPDMEETVKFFEEHRMPEFNRPTKYCSIKDEDDYALYDGHLYARDNPPLEAQRYREFISEDVISYSTAKQVRSGGSSIMVGALARINNNYDLISEKAKEAAQRLGLVPPCTNPFMNNIAQVVECVHSVYDSLKILDILGANLSSAPFSAFSGTAPFVGTDLKSVPEREGRDERIGVGVVEAPRGSLYHEYGIDDKGIIRSANCIIPTGQNLLNIENDIRAMVPSIVELPKSDIERRLEMLVRAYDPCISCSTHFLEVKFIE